MKKIATTLSLVLASLFLVTTTHAAESKKVCVMQKDAKTGKEKEVCKQVKQHKKLDGTAVPKK